MRTWQDALDYLYGLANWETRPPGSALTFELDRIRSVLQAIGEPHLGWPAVHVAGTNGKGSTCALAAAALRAAGYRVGLFTSPHLHTVRERIQVDGRPISEAAVLAWLDARAGILDGHRGLTTFEALTALAFEHFARAEVDVAVVEVGLGGRLDTTNVVRPVVSVFTPIGLDHTHVLGGTVAEIAQDKAGIVKRGVPVVAAPQTAEAWPILEGAVRAAGSRLVRVGREVTWSALGGAAAGQRLAVSAPGSGWEDPLIVSLPLVGPHQYVNGATALAALAVLAEAGWTLRGGDVVAGMEHCRWPGRFERLADRPALIVDGAHNPPAAAALVAALEARYPGARRVLVLGVSRDKDVAGILGQLLPGAGRVVVTQSEHPRALPAAALAEAVAAAGGSCAQADSPAVALDLALAMAAPDDVVVATGSIFLVADAREAWALRGGMAMPPRDPPPAAAADRTVTPPAAALSRGRPGEP